MKIYPFLAASVASVATPLSHSQTRHDSVSSMLDKSSAAGVEGLSTTSADPSGNLHLANGAGGVHGPCLVASRAIEKHACVFSVPLDILANASSWGFDTALGRALLAEGVVTLHSLLGIGEDEHLADFLVQRGAEASEFQGSEPMLVMWLLLQRRWSKSFDEAALAFDTGLACRRAYFENLDGPEVLGTVVDRCAFAWGSETIKQLLDGAPLAQARALKARDEMRRSFKTLCGILSKSDVWSNFCTANAAAAASSGRTSEPPLGEVSWHEYIWAAATVSSRAVRFGERGDRGTWSALFLEPVGDMLNHALPEPPSCNEKMCASKEIHSLAPRFANVFRFLNKGTRRIQYHAEDGGISEGSELLYSYSGTAAFFPADSLIYYGFSLPQSSGMGTVYSDATAAALRKLQDTGDVRAQDCIHVVVSESETNKEAHGRRDGTGF